MPTRIAITQTAPLDASPNATVNLGKGAEPITIKPPFTEAQEKELAWYFEEHVEFPFTGKVRARQAADSIVGYGTTLFEQVFAKGSPAYTAYKRAMNEGVHTLSFEIVGSPSFHSLHWEALREPDEEPFVLHAPMVRRPHKLVEVDIQAKESPTLNVLIVSARPNGTGDVSYRTISRPLLEAIGTGNLRVNVDIVRPGTYKAVLEHLEAVRDDPRRGAGFYHILHLDLHGAVLTLAEVEKMEAGFNAQRYVSYSPATLINRFRRKNLKTDPDKPPTDSTPKGMLFFESYDERPFDIVLAAELAQQLKNHRIPIVILNACQSAKEASADVSAHQEETSVGVRLMQEGAQVVVAMSYSVTVSAATLMMQSLYRDLFTQQDLPRAFRYARTALYNERQRAAYYDQTIELKDWLLPVVYQASDTPPVLPLREMTIVEQAQFYTQRATQYRAPDTEYGFVGRDTDLLLVEKKLLVPREGETRNLLLIQGMGGAGKSTFLRHAGEWWQQTNFVQEVFYFGYDAQAYTRDQILDAIARELFNRDIPQGMVISPQFAAFQSSAVAAKIGMVVQALKSTRHLLILDNLESVTAESLAIPNSLSKAEQTHLAEFLKHLRGGKTLVLMGSRSEEKWLEQAGVLNPQAGDHYFLPGLDPEAASTLIERIVERHIPDAKQREGIRNDAAFQRLREWLAGYPLALQVVFANLRRQTPEQILGAFKAGGDLDAEVDTNDAQSRTKSIMRCIEYSHSNLDADAQHLLLCLAPFTGVVNGDWLPQYSAQLQEHRELATLPFDRWTEVVQTATTWGLMTPHEIGVGYYRLQPTFPYFLQTRLNTEDASALRAAIERAFVAHYTAIAATFNRMTRAQEAHQQQLGYTLTQLEYENFFHALHLALPQGSANQELYYVLDFYFERTNNHTLGLAVATMVLEEIDRYLATTNQSYQRLQVQVLNERGSRYFRLQRYEEAHNDYQRALLLLKNATFLEEAVSKQSEAGTYHQLGMVAEAQRQWEAAVRYYQQSLAIREAFNDRYGKADTYHQLGRVAEEQRQWEAAEDYYQQSLAIREAFNDRYGKADTYHQLGMVAHEQRQWEAAVGYYQQSLAIREAFNDRYLKSNTFHHLGMVAEAQQQWEAAEDYYQQALAIKEAFNDRYSQASTYHHLGIVAQEQRQWEVAEGYYQQALAIFEEYNDYNRAKVLHQLGRVAEKQRQWEAAEDYYQQALAIKEAFNDRYSQANTYYHLGIVAQETGRFAEAAGYLIQGLSNSVEFGDEQGMGISLQTLARLWDTHPTAELLAQVGELFSIKPDEVKVIFEQMSKEDNLNSNAN